jgi:hypothetical protein
LQQQGECFIALGENALALLSLEKALVAQRNYPNSKNSAYQQFAELILKMELSHRYPEALAVLDEFSDTEPFPIMIYRTARARALLHDRLGNAHCAKTFAKCAINSANTTESPFRYHKKLGLVHTPESRMHKRLVELCK